MRLAKAIFGLVVFSAIVSGCNRGIPHNLPSNSPTASPGGGPAVSIPTHPTDRDPLDLAQRLGGKPPLSSRLAREVAPAYEVGQREQFWILDINGPSIRQADATLRFISPHAYFYVEDGASVTDQDLERAAQTFETEVYPKVTAAFGHEWSPGVDSDPRIAIFHGQLPGLGGYYTDQDEYPRAISAYSNEREILYLNAGLLRLGSTYKYVLAHELQHMIHWYADSSDESWVNEGLSEVANEHLGGGLSSIPVFLRNPDLQLTTWDAPGASSAAHYGVSHLFFRYLLARYGGVENAHNLLAEQADGVDGVNDYLSKGGFATTFEKVFADWVVANYLDDGSDGPYDHTGRLLIRPQPTVLDQYTEAGANVHQFAADYLELAPPSGVSTLTFEGATSVRHIPTDPHSGRGMWWSGRGDARDTSLTAAFDLRSLTKATLHFWTWYSIEEGWDYGYVLASADGGQTWQFMRGRYTSEANPVGQSYGPGYSGDSNGWVEESIDLSPYAGKQVLLRFEYVTDEGTNRNGWAIDDIAVPELNFLDDAETDGRWTAQGFQRLTEPLPQRFILQFIETRDGSNQVKQIPLDASNRANIALPVPNAGVQKTVLVIAAVADSTTEPASYRYSLRPSAP